MPPGVFRYTVGAGTPRRSITLCQEGWRLKKRTVTLLALVLALAAVLGLWLDFNVYENGSRTLPCEESGLILSITTFDGESESTPLVKCFGHTWISLDNRSGHPVYLKGCEIRDGEQVTLSVWAVRGLSGLLFNMEPGYIRDYGRYVGRRSLSANIGEEQLRTIEAYIDREDGWTLGENCSRWSLRLWNAVVEEDFALKTQTLVYTPERVEKALCEFDCVETDRDFSRAGNIFCFRDGVRTELALCS